MAKSGLLKDLGLGLGGAALLGTGLGAAGVGPMAGLFGAGEAATAGAGAAEAAGGLGATAGETAATAGTGLADAGTFFVPGTSEVLTGTGLTSFASPLAEAGSSLSGALPAAGQVAGAVSSTSDILGAAGGLNVPSDLGTSTLATITSDAPAAAGDVGAAVEGSPATNLASWWGGANPPTEDYFSQWWKNPAGPDFSGGRESGGAFDWLGRNQGWLKPAAALGGLGMAIGRDTGTIPGSGPVTAAAKDATTQGAYLTGQANQNLGALNTGALPAGAQSAIDSATRNAKASVRSQYAAMGMHTPPAALAAVDEQAGALKLAEAEKLTTLGVKEAGLAGGQQDLASLDYGLLMKESMQQNKDLADAIERFAKGLA